MKHRKLSNLDPCDNAAVTLDMGSRRGVSISCLDNNVLKTGINLLYIVFGNEFFEIVIPFHLVTEINRCVNGTCSPQFLVFNTKK